MFKTNYNREKHPLKQLEMNFKPSETVPDQTMSVKEIVSRYANGLPIYGQKVAIYEGEEQYMPDLTKMDLADREEMMNNVRDEINQLKTDFETKKRLKDKLDADKLEELREKQIRAKIEAEKASNKANEVQADKQKH